MDSNLSDQKPSQDKPAGVDDTSLVDVPDIVPTTPSTPPSTPAEEPVETPPEDAKEIPVKENINFIPKALLVLGSLVMVGLFGASFLMLKNAAKKRITTEIQERPLEQYVVETLGVPEDAIVKVLLNAPKNPDKVSVKCKDSGEIIKSGIPTSCYRPVFTWSGEKTNEPNTQIVGYYVYLGENNNDSFYSLYDPPSKFKRGALVKPQTDGVFTREKSFIPTNLEKGKTYYFAVTAVSNSKDSAYRIGFSAIDVDNIAAQIAKVLFVLKYE